MCMCVFVYVCMYVHLMDASACGTGISSNRRQLNSCLFPTLVPLLELDAVSPMQSAGFEVALSLEADLLSFLVYSY